MRYLFVSIALVLLTSSVALAQGYANGRYDEGERRPVSSNYDPAPFETRQDSIARHSAQNYNTYRDNNFQAPLGGYSSPLGDPAPRGTWRPGMVDDD